MAQTNSEGSNSVSEISLDEADRIATNNDEYYFEELWCNGSYGPIFSADAYSSTPKSRRSRIAILLINLPFKIVPSFSMIEHLMSRKHPCIVEAKECYTCYDPPAHHQKDSNIMMPTPRTIAVVTGDCSSYNLENFLSRYTVSDGETRLRWYANLAGGMQYLHSHGYLHWDLKPENIWISNETLKIGFAGIAKLIWHSYHIKFPESHYGSMLSVFKSSRPYIPPETTERGEYTKQSEVFALGLVFLLIAEAPDGSSHSAQWKGATKSLGTLLSLEPEARLVPATSILSPAVERCSVEELELVNRMLSYDCSKRPSMNIVAETVGKWQGHVQYPSMWSPSYYCTLLQQLWTYITSQ